MTIEKFRSEVLILKKFFETYCESKNYELNHHYVVVEYNGQRMRFDFHLCDEYFELIIYSIEKLLECPHQDKPRCRNCPTPCYDKQQWKSVAKIMKYSGMKLGVAKIKNFLYIN